MNVFVVDDSMAMRMVIIKTLKKAGFDGHNFLQAPDGAAALEAIRKATPDVVLCDWNMPNMTGMELLTTLRAEGNKVKFGFITTETTAEMRAKAMAAGALFLVAKPFTVESFAQALAPVLK
jgi:two-component system chemotaxis response regulator CheY